MKALLAALALATLAGCSLLQPAPSASADNWTRWVCDSQAEVLWRFADASQDAVDVRLGGGDQVYRLKSEPGASGALYSDGVLAFHTKGDEGLVYWVATNDLIGRGCKAP
ncbi:Membrane-bound inhibitor of C-type lysozyme [Pseudomonas guariconensis]|uniref:MliC family protein n=1 Tax=Pseudomonas TaxID=286 RepID=UPI0008838AA4|nr:MULTISPECIES: MliC family protein [Pseudomonas]MCO7622730.1 MliC family protein [Pseudomonas guariconensis]MDM9592176.1 MliC family protein [Pseudomonas guariconensis]MDM9605003.1 MliC family protein [Pseudomonas guariconensis]MDM9609960.1 MliC family protein [Pseudomonas guariconensis]URD43143.1 MliC family protein [Pseudomonas sp. BYT-5]